MFKRVSLRLAKPLRASRIVVRWAFDRRGGMLVFIARTALFSLLVDLTVLMPLLLIGYWLAPQPETVDIVPMSVIGLLVIAPVFENAFLVFLIELLTLFDLRRSTIVVVIAALSGIVHGLAGGWRAIAGATGFAIMAISYFAWEERRALQRYFMTIAQHVTMNLLPALVPLLLV